MIGKMLGNRYEVLEEIGSGGMAIVYKARCHLLNRFVAVKVLRLEFEKDDEFIKRFNIEAQAAASLSHTNIVSVYDVGYQDGRHYIVMELVDGITLKDYIEKSGYLGWREALDFSLQICSALEHAHSKSVIHRDVKPHNMIISKEGILKVTDFGIARAVNANTLTLGGNTIGSVHYFSPEQARGNYTDERSDIYSMGMVMYEMLTGKVPFDGNSPVAIAIMHIQEEPPEPVTINPAIPKALNAIVKKAISKDRDERFSSAKEMRIYLESVKKNPNSPLSLELSTVNDYATKRVMPVKIKEPVEKSDYQSKPYRNRPMLWATIAGIATAVVALTIIIISFMNILDLFPNSAPVEAKAPYLIDKKFDDIKSEYAEKNIEIVVEKREYDNDKEEGVILKQDPLEGRTVKLPATVKVVVSKGPEMVKVPLLVNKRDLEAEIEINNKKLSVRKEYEYSPTIPEDIVIRQDPAPETSLKSGGDVTIYISLGREQKKIKVPNLIGKDQEEAKRLILLNGLVVGDVSPSSSNKKTGTVLEQSIDANTEVDELTEISIVVSEQIPVATTVPPTLPPTEAPTPTPTPTPEPEQPVMKTKTIKVSLPKDRDLVNVKVYVDGVLRNDSDRLTSENFINVEVKSAAPQAEVSILFDDVLALNQEVNMLE